MYPTNLAKLRKNLLRRRNEMNIWLATGWLIVGLLLAIKGESLESMLLCMILSALWLKED